MPIGSKKNKAQSDKQGDVADDEWEAVCYHRSARYSATDAEALAMGIVNKNGLGDGRGLGLAGGTEFVLSVLEFETDLTAANIVSAAWSAISDLANEAVRDAGAAAGITSGRGVSLNVLGGPKAIAAAAASAKVTPDEHVEAMGTVVAATLTDRTEKLVDELLDAIQLRARDSIDPEFGPNFNIRAWLEADGRPSWVPVRDVHVGKGTANIRSAEFVALIDRITTAYEVAKEHFTRDMTPAAAKKIGPRNRKVEHIVLTSTVTVKDALARVWHRHRMTEAKKIQPEAGLGFRV